MASEKPTRILKSKTELTDQEIEKLTDFDAWQIIYSLKAEKKIDKRLQICFTGFSPSRKDQLLNLTSLDKFKIVSSVTKNLTLLICGEAPGPKKIEKSENQGVHIITENEFLTFLDSGELPKTN